jgi:hypothetical protein
MTREEILRMAESVGFYLVDFVDDDKSVIEQIQADNSESLYSFAALVAAAERERMDLNAIHSCHAECQNPFCIRVREAVAHEREACAKVCEDARSLPDVGPLYCAAAIRARGV